MLEYSVVLLIWVCLFRVSSCKLDFLFVKSECFEIFFCNGKKGVFFFFLVLGSGLVSRSRIEILDLNLTFVNGFVLDYFSEVLKHPCSPWFFINLEKEKQKA